MEKPHVHGPECSECGATDEPMYLHSKCHTNSPTWTKRSADGKTLSVECSVCRKHIASFEVVAN